MYFSLSSNSITSCTYFVGFAFCFLLEASNKMRCLLS